MFRIKVKGSYTIEAAIIMSLFLFTIVAVMKISLSLYTEVKNQKEHEVLEKIWVVDDFYRLSLLERSKK